MTGESYLPDPIVLARVSGARVVHEPANGSGERTIATEVERAESRLSQARGLMFRRSIPEEFALVLETGQGSLGGPGRQNVHMLFVRFPLDVVWLVDDEVTRVAQLCPWRGFAAARADRILELPAGNATAVEPGDTVRVEHDGR